jgi:AraC-like DNA-binding protein
MISYPIHTDIVQLLSAQIDTLQSFADANQVHLKFSSVDDVYQMKLNIEHVLPDFIHLLCKVIIFTPQEHEVIVTLKYQKSEQTMQVTIFAKGALLEVPKHAFNNLETQIVTNRIADTGTEYSFNLNVGEKSTQPEQAVKETDRQKSEIVIPDFYKKFRKQLKSHITTYQNLEQQAGEMSTGEGILMKKVNRIILAHLGDETFDTSTLSQALALSRTQLYRKLKPLIRQSPGKYIRFVRLQRAKEMLAETDLSVGDIGDKVGFSDQSHFTRAFKTQYGYNPSYIRSNANSQIASVQFFQHNQKP